VFFILFALAALTWWGVYSLLRGTPLRLFDWKWKGSDIWKSALAGLAALAVSSVALSILR
jgi:apolipoprotein N-acyltransferase